ncbi:MAG: hypothetical protein C0591_12700 [Marinilabiliales bacterium]|nr:MAG: hypothetical protein C0591_12700 [Marinilabiliales bacterium]
MKSNYIIIIGLLVATMLATTGCKKYPYINGNGQVTTEKRQLVSFNQVDNSGTFNVFVKQDSVFTATVEAESNLIPYVRTIINGNTLEIDTRENFRENYPINVYVTTPTIQGIELSGSGYVKIDSVDADYLQVILSGSGQMDGYAVTNSLVAKISGSVNINLESYTNTSDIKISGSGDINLTGESLSGSCTISGSGQINSYSFTQNECTAKISGSGNMFLNVVNYLDVTISGSGSIYYIGDPSINVSITGSGQLIKQ